MNWTGGRLHRHSAGNRNGAAARQKQHFAKIQQTLRARTKRKSPPKKPILSDISDDRERYTGGSSANRGPESFHNSRSYPLRQKHDSYLQQTSKSYQTSRRSPFRPHAESYREDPPSLTNRREAIVTAQQQESASALRSPVPKHRSASLETNLYDATPPPRRSSIKREAPSDLRDPGYHEDNEENEKDLSEIRRRLLQKGDWAGVRLRDPIGVKFVSSKTEQNIGRRKKITDGHRAKYQSRQTHVTSPFAAKRRRLNSPQAEDMRLLQQKTDVRISVGGKLVPPGISSSSTGGRGRSRSIGGGKTSFTESSDVMLLDGGDGTKTRCTEGLRSDPRKPHQFSEQIPKHYRHHTMEPRTIDEREVSMRDHKYYGFPDILPTHDRAASMLSKTDKRQFAFGSHGIETGDFNEEFYITPSQPLPIHHPKPRSLRLPGLLRSDTSEILHSTVAQVGARNPVIPESQMMENDIWATWIGLSSDDSGRRGAGLLIRTKDDSVAISPGISTLSATRQFERMNREDIQPSPLEMPDYVGDNDFDQDADLLLKDDNANEFFFQLSEEETNSFKIGHAFDKYLVAKDITQKPQEATQEDADEIWRKFVFGGVSDEVEIHDSNPLQALSTTNQRLTLDNISNVGQYSTEASHTGYGYNDRRNFKIAGSERSSSVTLSNHLSEEERDPLVTRSLSLRAEKRLQSDQFQREEGWTSTHATDGSSNKPTGSEPTPTAPMTAHAPSSSSIQESMPSQPQRKVLFTKPKPFVGRNPNPYSEEEPLHIGRALRDRLEGIASTKRTRDVYDLDESDELFEEIEDG